MFELIQDTGCTNRVGIISQGGFNDGKWHHVLARRQARHVTLFLDGCIAAQGDTAGVANISNGNPLTFGSSAYSDAFTHNWYSGSVDEVQLYNRAVTDTESAKLAGLAAPVISCPADFTTTLLAGTSYSGSIGTATVNVCGYAVSSSPAGPYPVGTTRVTWTAKTSTGETLTCMQSVVVSVPPLSIACPASINLGNDAGSCAAGVQPGQARARGGCSPQVAGTRSDGKALGLPYPVGSMTITWTATDACGQTASCRQTVVVSDTEKPTITAPAAVTASTDLGQCSAAAANVNLGTPTTGDNCGVASVTNDAPVTFPKGTTTVTWMVTDTSGNSTSATQLVTVKDTQASAIAKLTPSKSVLCKHNNKMVPITIAALVTDNCDLALVTKIISVTSNEVKGCKGDRDDRNRDRDPDDDRDRHEKEKPDFVITGDLSLWVRAERNSKGLDQIYTITVQSTDRSGNSSTRTVTVTVPRKECEDKDRDNGDRVR